MKVPERVVVVVDFAYVEGGASRAALASALALRSAGLEVDVFAGAGPALDGWEELAPTICGLEPIGEGSGHAPVAAVRNIWNRRAGAAMAEYLSDSDPATTIVHLHTWTKVLSPSVVDAAVKRGFRVVATAHEYFLACPTGSFFHHGDGQICNRTPLSADCISTQCDSRGALVKGFRLVRFGTQKKLGRMPAALSGVVFVSERLGERLRAADPTFGSLPTRAVVSPSAPPLPRTEPNQVERPSFIAVGRLDPEKGMDVFAEAASMLGDGVAASIVGTGRDEELIRERHPHVELVGWLSGADTEGRLASASCMVMPSRWDEPYGLVVDEAARLGVPSIAPEGTDAGRRVLAGNFGDTFISGDAGDLARVMAEVSDPELHAELSVNARDWYEQNWQSPTAYADQMLEFYREATALD